jgi:hypothetical protein
MSRLRKVVDAYKTAAVVAVNTLLLLVVINLGLGAQRFVRETVLKPSDPVTAQYGESVMVAYPGASREDVRAMLAETWNRRFRFHPYAQFVEGPFAGRFVNVHEAGFRSVGADRQAPWPPEPGRFNVFCFGGSTMFGYGVRDGQTIAAALQRALAQADAGREVAVYNFGQGWHQSEQQRVLLESLLTAGFRPDVVVMLHGLNDLNPDLWREPFGSGELRGFAEGERSWTGDARRMLLALPLGRAVQRAAGLGRSAERGAAETDAAEALARMERTRKLVRAAGAEFGFAAVFAWQPVPAYGFVPRAGMHPFAAQRADQAAMAAVGYALRLGEGAKWPLGADEVDCSGLHNEVEGAAYCDAVHYSPALSERIGRKLAEEIVARGVMARR